jgi:pimeloyl-ACP methyl ester carboxylesterase
MTALDRRGPADAPVVVFVHGAGISRKMWLPQTESLSEDFRTVAPDLPGHGDRADEPFRFEVAVETVETIVRGVSATCAVLVGQSLGGYVATEVAARHPDHIAGLVLSGSSAEYRGLLGFRTAVSSLLFRLGARSHTVTDWFEGVMTERLRSLSLPGETVDEILGAGPSLDAWGQAGSALVGRDFPARLAAYGGPVLLVNGEGDRINRPAAIERNGELADGTVVVIREAGHTVNLERPDAYSSVVREFVLDHCGEGSPSGGVKL